MTKAARAPTTPTTAALAMLAEAAPGAAVLLPLALGLRVPEAGEVAGRVPLGEPVVTPGVLLVVRMSTQ